MLKLRHLFDNRDLAGMLLADWAHDDPADQLFGSFRISSNATYPFRRSGKTCFLRFSPVDEKQPEAVLAELEFIRFLRGQPMRPEDHPVAVGRGAAREGDSVGRVLGRGV